MTDVPRTEFKKSLQHLAERIRSRRTVKMFLQQPVSRELILEAIEVARWAPNHHLTEPWHFYLLGDEAIQKSVDLTRIVVTERRKCRTGRVQGQGCGDPAGPGWWLAVSARMMS